MKTRTPREFAERNAVRAAGGHTFIDENWHTNSTMDRHCSASQGFLFVFSFFPTPWISATCRTDDTPPGRQGTKRGPIADRAPKRRRPRTFVAGLLVAILFLVPSTRSFLIASIIQISTTATTTVRETTVRTGRNMPWPIRKSRTLVFSKVETRHSNSSDYWDLQWKRPFFASKIFIDPFILGI